MLTEQWGSGLRRRERGVMSVIQAPDLEFAREELGPPEAEGPVGGFRRRKGRHTFER